MTELLRADDVTRTFGSFTAVNAVSMSVSPGEVVGLLGANGAGKTTLIRMLLGLLPTTEGSVRLLGGRPTRTRRRRLGYVSQSLGLYDDLTVGQNLAFSAQSYGVSVPQLPTSLAGRKDRLVRELSLGLQRQLAFIAALAPSPDVLVLDEPTSGVDALARSDLWDTVRAQAEKGVGVLVTTHYMQEAAQCDRLLLMSEGALVGQGSEADIVGDTTAVAVHTDDWSSAFTALEQAGEAVMLAGRDIRVADGDAHRLGEILAGAGITAQFTAVPATIEERMVVLSRNGSRKSD